MFITVAVEYTTAPETTVTGTTDPGTVSTDINSSFVKISVEVIYDEVIVASD